MSRYNGQQTFGANNSWFIDDEGVTRNRWTDETVDEMKSRAASGLATLRKHCLGNTPEAAALRRQAGRA